jgi:transposase
MPYNPSGSDIYSPIGLINDHSEQNDVSENEYRRSIVLRRVDSGALSLEQATRILNLSYRQLKRVWKRYREEGDTGLVHRSKGKPSNRAFQDDLRREILRQYRECPVNVGPTRFAGRLAEQGITIDHETLRRWLLDSGSWKRRRNRPSGRQAESGASGFGEKLWLTSLHDAWLGPSAPSSFLLCLRDEATSISLFTLSQEESSEAAMRLICAWIDRYGIPVALQCQRRFFYDENRHPTLEQQLSGGESFSALRRSCDRVGIELGVMSPMRVKLMLHDLQPATELIRRELGARPVQGLEGANDVVQGAVADELNRRVLPRVETVQDCHVAIVDGTDLRRFFCVERECRVERNGVVDLGARRFRLMEGFGSRRVRPFRVIVSEWLDGSIHILYQGKEVPFVEVRRPPARPDRMAI